jgi:hypothetical protein
LRKVVSVKSISVKKSTRVLGIAAAIALGTVMATGIALPASAVEATNPGFENGLTGWAALSGTNLSVTSVSPHTGNGAASLSRKTTSGVAGLTDAPNQFTQIPTGSTCTATAWVKGPAGLKATVKWIALNGTTKVSSTSKTTTFIGTGWQQLTIATLTMPSGASTADLQFVAPAFPTGKTWFLDDVTASCAGGSTPPPPTSGDAARWLFNEPAGTPPTALDSSPNKNNGTNFDISSDGNAYSFNGSSSRVIVKDSPTLDPGTANFSFGVSGLAIGQGPAVGETYDVLRKGLSTTTGGDYKLEIAESNGAALARCIVKDAQKVPAIIRAGTDLVGGTHTVVCKRIGNSVSIVIDGTTRGTKTVTALGTVSNGADLAIGAKAEGTAATGFDWFLGEIGEAWVSID